LVPLESVCDGFVLGKCHRENFEKEKPWRPKTRLELVHSDLCTMNHPSLVGARYVLTFINYFSRFTWAYFLKTKDMVIEHFKDFKEFTVTQCGGSMKCLRSNNGGKYE
jgi:hypothetical protein